MTSAGPVLKEKSFIQYLQNLTSCQQRSLIEKWSQMHPEKTSPYLQRVASIIRDSIPFDITGTFGKGCHCVTALTPTEEASAVRECKNILAQIKYPFPAEVGAIVAAYLEETQRKDLVKAFPNEPVVEQANQIPVEENENLIKMFHGIFPNVTFKGTSSAQANQMREWMRKNQDKLDKIVVPPLSDVGLTFIPQEVMLFRNATIFWGSRNNITCVDNVRWPNSLTHIILDNNRIASVDRANWPNSLTCLDLDNNRITSVDQVSWPYYLTTLLLSHNRITSVDQVSWPYYLANLYLSHNRITSVNQASWPRSLGGLDLSGNQIASVDQASWPNSLHWLSLNNNQLTRIPRSLLNSPRLRVEYSENPLARHAAIDVNTASTFQEDLSNWIKECLNDEKIDLKPYEPLFNLNKDNTTLLHSYLKRLREVADYQNANARKNIQARVLNMLQLASQNKEFRESILAEISEGLSSCGDRVLLVFNNIEVLWNWHRQNLSESDARKLAIRIQRYQWLKEHAHEVGQRLHLHDEIETTLYFHLALNEEFNLPITTKNMLYPSMSGITTEMLKTAKNALKKITDEELLSKSGFWQKYLQKKSQPFEEEKNTLESRYQDLVEAALEYGNLTKEEDKKKFLKEHPTLQGIIESHFGSNQAIDINALCKKISQLRDLELENLAATHSASHNKQCKK